MTSRTLLATAGFLALSLAPIHADEEAKVFSKAVADIGIVVQDIDKSVKFYTEVLGCKEVKGFSVPAEKTTAFGLADNQPATIRVFVLGEDEAHTSPKQSTHSCNFDF